MYNFKSFQTIPSQPSVAVAVCLKPWFETDVLVSALALIRESSISHFFFHRHFVGALFQNNYPITIVFEPTIRIPQGFTIKTEHCSLCKTSRKEKRCVHVAALCLLSMVEAPDASPAPMVLHYRDSIWGALAGFLHDWLGQERGRLESIWDDKKTSFKRTASTGGLEAQVPSCIAAEWELFDRESTPPAISKLYKTATRISLSENEQQLNTMGSTSRLQERDLSFWNRLCSLFYGFGSRKPLQVSYIEESGLFMLLYRDNESTGHLKIYLPKHRTTEIIGQLDYQSSVFSTLRPARQGFGVKIDEKGQILVEPLAWRSEQRTVLLSEISDKKFGNYYFFPEKGFLPLKKHAPESKIVRPLQKHTVNPLFDVLKEDTTFVVAESELQAFLEDNKSALVHPDNKVDPKILELQVISLPESLIIHSFKEDHDWCYISCDYGIGSRSISLDELLDSRGKYGALRVGVTSLQLNDTPLSWFYDLASKRRWSNSRGQKGVRLLPGELIALISAIEDVQTCLQDRSFHNHLQTLLDTSSWNNPGKVPHIPDHLRTYQRNGLAWLYTLHELGFGGLLADDMGLGKTHQGLALLEAIRRKKKDAVMLVICPASVLPHWRDKIDHFYPDLNSSLYYGQNRDLPSAILSGLILTTYGVTRSDQKKLKEINFEIILLDEIQNLKNQKTVTHQAVSSLQSRVKIGLSGTPIENSLSDLFALFNICLPGIFGSANNFRNTFVKPITEDHDKKQKNRLSQLIQPFILRRSRTQVLTELPDLIEDNRLCELSEDQVALYRQTIEGQQSFLEGLEGGEKKIDYMNILTLITRLKQICNHPCLVERHPDPDKYKSGKWDLFVELLNESLGNGLKVVVFSQYTGMLDIIEYYLERAGIGYAGLRGGMSVAKREKMIKQFTQQKECMVFSSSLLAGGTGIDLLAGQVVIHYDRWWNPAKEEQATARVHRMGQKEVVQLFRLITTGTLESKIHNLIHQKRELASSIINEDEGGIIKQLNHTQLVELFR